MYKKILFVVFTLYITIILCIFFASTYFNPSLINKDVEENAGVTTVDSVILHHPDNTKSLIKLAEFYSLKNKIITKLGDKKDNYGIYIKNFDTEREIGINEDKILPPASITKIPIAMLILKDVDEGKLKLSDKSKIEWIDWANPTNIYTASHVGNEYTIDEFLNALLVYSDNTSIRKLERILGGSEEVNKRSVDELGVKTFFRDPHDSTAKDIGLVFELIYKQSFLSKDSNDYLLNLMLNTDPTLQDGIPALLPKKTKVAQKTGRILTENGFAWNDAAIVYGPKADFLLVVINQDVDSEEAKKNTAEISKMIYEEVNN